MNKIKTDCEKWFNRCCELEDFNIKLTSKINKVKEELLFLHCLYETGVENWDGFPDAKKLHRQTIKEIKENK